MKVLILDDDPVRHAVFAKRYGRHERTHTMTAREAIDALVCEDRFDTALLDHDLGDFGLRDEQTGYEVAKWIADMAPEVRPLRVVVHSWNAAGAKRMVDALTAAGVTAWAQPFRGEPVTMDEVNRWNRTETP